MTLPNVDEIEQLSQLDLVALVKALIIENQQLRAELDKLRKPPASSGNSSLPPSRDQKRNVKGKRRKKHGPRFGHARAIRPLVDNPDQVIEATVQRCEHCQTGLEGVPPEKILRHQITGASDQSRTPSPHSRGSTPYPSPRSCDKSGCLSNPAPRPRG